ncbi:ribonuclease H-like domain-containing protein [Xylariales sp. AK1849]|nr:ribonuclease H-like domain-containing protein [Xylariales sp. AK1849]
MRLNLRKGASSGLIDTEEALRKVLDSLENLPTHPPSLYVDLEGISLSRHGSISILQLLVLPAQRTHLIDVFAMKDRAFNTPNSQDCTLKDFLESPAIPKVFFDVRNDSDALHSHFKVSLRGVQDLQLMQLATRSYRRAYLCGLAKCVEKDAGLSAKELDTWQAGKVKGLELFTPERGGRYDVLNRRPLPEPIRRYCVEDVRIMPRLWEVYDGKLTASWRERVERATDDRLLSSQSPSYDPKSPEATLAPAGWDREGRRTRLQVVEGEAAKETQTGSG